MKPWELRLEEAVCRVALKAAADSPPVVTTAEVRCLLEATASTVTDDETDETYTTWDERQATFEIWMLKANRASPLIVESSAGQTSHMNQVYEHCLLMAQAYEPWSAR